MVIVLVVLGCVVLLVFGIKLIKTMLSIEKKSKQTPPQQSESAVVEEYHPADKPVKDEQNKELATDHVDEDFFDYSSHVRNRNPKPYVPDFDFEGDFADDFEYTPSSPEFNYTSRHVKPKQDEKSLADNLLDMPEALKVLMLSDIFDKLF